MLSGYRFRRFVLALMLTSVAPLEAASLSDWASSYESPETQKAILNGIFPGQIGSQTAAPANRFSSSLLFAKGGMWVSLGKSYAYESNERTKYFVVSCMTYPRLDRQPISATTYLFTEYESRGVALTGGYAAFEAAKSILLPKLNRSLILIESSSPNGSRGDQLTAYLYDTPAPGSRRVKVVWTSPRSLWKFRFGFDSLGSKQERLVVKSLSGNQSSEDYFVYRWAGDRFERDEFASDGVVEDLGDEVWQYGQ